MKPYEILGLEAYRDPLGEITRLFTDVMDLQGWRSELRTFENGLYRTQKTYMGNKPKAHKRILRELEKMLAVGLAIGEAFTDEQEVSEVGILDLVENVPYGENYFREVKELPCNLHLDAIKFPRKHLKMISIDYSMDQLLEMLRQWSHICLSKERASEYNIGDYVPKTYEPELIKLTFQVVECCHLILVRSRKKKEGEKEDFTLYPVPEEVKDAFKKIQYKFNSIPFPRWREVIAVAKTGIFDEKPVWYGSSPTEFLLTLENLKELVTLSGIITHNYTQPDWMAKATFDSVLPKTVNREVYEISFPFHFPLLLNEEQIQNPMLFLDGFFDLEEGEKWLDFIDYCAKECLDCHQPMIYGFSQKKLDKLDDVLRMVEAIHLLLIRFDEEKNHILVKNI